MSGGGAHCRNALFDLPNDNTLPLDESVDELFVLIEFLYQPSFEVTHGTAEIAHLVADKYDVPLLHRPPPGS